MAEILFWVGLFVFAVVVYLYYKIYVVPIPAPLYDYSAQVVTKPAERAGETPIYRHFAFGDELVTHQGNVFTLYDNLKNTTQKQPNAQFLGTRKINTDGSAGSYEFITYREAWNQAQEFGSGLIHNNLMQPAKGFIGICAKNRSEWVLADGACYMYSWASVPLYDTLGEDAVKFIINQSEIGVVVCSMETYPLIVKSANQCPSLKHIVVMDKNASPNIPANATFQVHKFYDLISVGQSNPKEHVPVKADDIATICYTSGTTGNPKGAMLTHAALIADATGALCMGVPIGPTDTHISYLPLAHVFERMVQVILIAAGSRIGFYQGDVMKLVGDIQELKPTVFCSAPRLFNRIYNRVIEQVAKGSAIKRFLFNFAFGVKKNLMEKYGVVTHPFLDKIIFKKVATMTLGGNVKYILSASAPVSAEVMAFLRIVYSCDVVEAYGMTESAGASTTTLRGDTVLGHVGVPLPSCEIKLVDVPEMNYYSTDKPFPRGEVCFRGPTIFKGYYKSPELTKESIYADGWLHSGDIGEIREGGRLRIFDRRKNIFKLAQGEYIAPEKIENIYAQSKYVQQSFVYGDSLKPTLVGVIVPNPETIKLLAPTKSLEEACNDPAVVKSVLTDLLDVGKKGKLFGFEQVKAIHLDPTPFSVENDLLTPTFKLKRQQAKIHYQGYIDKLYAKLGE